MLNHLNGIAAGLEMSESEVGGGPSEGVKYPASKKKHKNRKKTAQGRPGDEALASKVVRYRAWAPRA